MTLLASAQARIRRILRQFDDPQTPGLAQLASVILSDDAADRIDDGARYTPDGSTEKPDFVKEHLNGWK